MSAKQAEIQGRIEAEIADPLRELALDVEAVEITPAGKRRVLRVAVDKDGGVTLDDVAEATRLIDTVLEASDVMGEHPYTLEVTSRGVDRPLTLPRHWRRNADRLVKVTLADGTDFTGRIGSTDETRAIVEVSGVDREVAYADVEKALVQIEFNRRKTADVDDVDDTTDEDEEGDA
ncbi:ribosome maturation factor RimP [Nocardioides lijunqiniae]|uniref:ribosome maturation factor RimP n=1 Tax=Nocardioides lijunqiniae TaxID=2760832 RepID=UPI001878D61F|nr:ribosome maturation factor RimP [Nocardioides lijunqiniae]